MSPTPSASSAPPEPEPVDHVGPAVSHVHGTVQVAVRIRGGLIVDAWAVQYPTAGEALAINQEAIPRLRARTISAQSASFATVSGATLTSNAWKDSLQAALLEAGW